MKTRFMTFLASAYVTAMLASSLTPVRARATLASAIDPDVAVWLAAAAAATPAPKEPVAMLTHDSAKPKAENDPVMTEELMARLVKYARNTTGTTTFDARMCKALELCDGTEPMKLKMLGSDIDEHFLAVPIAENSKDVLVIVRHGTTRVDLYLTDKTGALRAAAVSEASGTRLILNENAAAGFKAEMTQYAKEAGALPPTGGTRVAQG